MTERFCWMNGVPATALPLDDRAMHYGDGVFRTLRVVDGQVDDLDGQLSVLAHACEALLLDPAQAHSARPELIRCAEQIGTGTLKCIISRGSAPRGDRPPEDAEARRIIQAGPLPATTPKSALLLQEPSLLAAPMVKTLNRLPQVQAQMAAAAAGCDEALLRNSRGEIVCATSGNLFVLLADGQWVTPPTESGAQPGRMRARVLAAFSGEQCVEESAVSESDLETARAVFLSNSVRGIFALRTVQQGASTWSYAAPTLHSRLAPLLYLADHGCKVRP